MTEITEQVAFKYCEQALIFMGYPENIKVYSYVGDNDYPMYYAMYKQYYDGEMHEHMKPFNMGDIAVLLTEGIELNGMKNIAFDIRVKDGKLCYAVENEVINEDLAKKKKF